MKKNLTIKKTFLFTALVLVVHFSLPWLIYVISANHPLLVFRGEEIGRVLALLYAVNRLLIFYYAIIPLLLSVFLILLLTLEQQKKPASMQFQRVSLYFLVASFAALVSAVTLDSCSIMGLVTLGPIVILPEAIEGLLLCSKITYLLYISTVTGSYLAHFSTYWRKELSKIRYHTAGVTLACLCLFPTGVFLLVKSATQGLAGEVASMVAHPEADCATSVPWFTWFFGKPGMYCVYILGFCLIKGMLIYGCKLRDPGSLRLTMAVMLPMVVIEALLWGFLYGGFSTYGFRGHFVNASLTEALSVVLLNAQLVPLLRQAVGKEGWSAPALFSAGFIMLSLLRAMLGVPMSIYGAEYSIKPAFAIEEWFSWLYIVGMLCAIHAASYFWFEKLVGVPYHQRLAKAHFWLCLMGVLVICLGISVPYLVWGLGGVLQRSKPE